MEACAYRKSPKVVGCMSAFDRVRKIAPRFVIGKANRTLGCASHARAGTRYHGIYPRKARQYGDYTPLHLLPSTEINPYQLQIQLSVIN